MARVSFLQLSHYELHGPQSIAAVLSSQGHQCQLVIPGLDKRPMESMQKFKPRLVGIGHTTVERSEALMWARAVKERMNCMVVLGGVDPTFQPDLARDPAVDALVRGEGEYAMLEIMEQVEHGVDLSEIEGVAFCRDGELIENPVRPLIQDLDSLPFPRKDLYLENYRYFRKYPIKFFMASRGCPHHCSYCANPSLKALYPDPQHYVRFKSPGYLIEEIKSVLDKYPARTVAFGDDLFTYKLSWMQEFLPRYKQEVGLPFYCCARIDSMTEEKAALLADSGCYTCWYGLESANPETREMILNRKMSNQAIRQGARILHDRGVLTQSYNMMNIPGEGLDDGIETLKFNIELKNKFLVASLFQPFPGTEITRKLVSQGKIKEPESLASRESLSYFAFSPFRQEDTDKLINLQKLFIYGSWFPRLAPLIKRMCALPRNPVFDILFLVSFGIDYGRVHMLKPWEVLYYNLRHLWTTYIARSRFVPNERE